MQPPVVYDAGLVEQIRSGWKDIFVDQYRMTKPGRRKSEELRYWQVNLAVKYSDN